MPSAAILSRAGRKADGDLRWHGRQKGVTEVYLLVSASPLQVDERRLCIVTLEDVTEHREAYTVGIRELHGTSPVMRKAMNDLLEGIAQDSGGVFTQVDEYRPK